MFFLQTPGRMAYRIISSDAENINKSNLHVFLFYINIIISYSIKTFAKKQACGCTEGRLHLIYIIATAIG